MIMACTCKHEYQDKLHGYGRRVCNFLTDRLDGTIQGRCTVCAKVNSIHKAGQKTKTKTKKKNP